MKKLNTSPISGMQELLPSEQAIFDKIKKQIVDVYHHHGFQHIETPIIDRTEILLAKAGGDTEKQIYKVVKTAETADSADQALRFDHTVPLARYVVEHENDLAFPFRVTQIDRNFRGERAQKGRFREFYQLDADVIGRGTLSVAYDAEVVATAADALKTFIKEDFVIRVSNRKIISGLLQEMGLSNKSTDISSIIDHAEKVTPEKTHSAFEEIGLSASEISTLESFMRIKGSCEEVMNSLQALNIKNDIFQAGLDELKEVLTMLEAQGIDSVIGDMLIIRGLDYYTGTVFETFMPKYREIGSICSGGRYENLAGHYTDQALPGVGISIGLTRLFFILNEYGLLDDFGKSTDSDSTTKPIDIAIIPLSENERAFSLHLAGTLREKNFSTDVILTDKRLGDKMSHAAKIANFGVVIGESEAGGSEILIKNFATGEKLPLDDFLVKSTQA